jgi:hypothetical protein
LLAIIKSKFTFFNFNLGQIEVDESYFGARRVRGKRGCGALGKTIVLGLLKRGDKVYAEIVSAVLHKIVKLVKNGVLMIIHIYAKVSINCLSA